MKTRTTLLVASFGILGISSLSAQSLLPTAPLSYPANLEQQTLEIDQETPFPDVMVQGNPMTVVVNSLSSGEWNNGLNWDCGCSPTLIHEVHILDGHTITLTQDQMAETVVIEEGGTLMFAPESNATATLRLNGSLLVYGEMDGQNARLNFAENGLEHVLVGEADCEELMLEDAGDVILEGPLTVRRRVDMIGAMLYTNDQLHLHCHADGFNGIGETTESILMGEIVLHRNMVYPVGEFGAISAGVMNASFAQWNDDFMTTGFTGSDFPASSFVSVLRYEESAMDESSSFQGPADVSEIIDPLDGYYIYANPGTYPVDISGDALMGSISTNLSRTADSDPFNEGLHFMANPYAAVLDWTKASGWSRENIGNAIYQWDNAAQQTSAFVGGIGVNGGSGEIRMMESFWVRSLADGAEFGINESAKMLDDQTEIATESSVLSIAVTNGNFNDEIALAFAADASDGYDPQWDAHKFYAGTVGAEIAWMQEDADLAIQRIAPNAYGNNHVISISVIAAGTYNMVIENNLGVTDACMAIEDTETGEIYPLNETVEFSFASGVVSNQPRFVLHFGTQAQAVNGMVTCHDDFDGEITVGGTGAGPWNYTWYNEDGMVIRQMDQYPGPDTHFNLEPGVYTVEIGPNDFCPSLTVTAEVQMPPAINLFSSHENVDCGEDLTGSIEVEVNGGIPPYNYQWNQGSTGNMLFNLAGGIYTLTLTDANGCELIHSITIDEAQDVTADFDYNATTLPLINGQAVLEVSSTSIGADELQWSFGDGNNLGNVESTTHTYYAPGIYVVALTASNADCSDTYQVVIQVEEGTGLQEVLAQSFVLIPTEDGWVLEAGWSSTYTEIDIFNLLGQKVMDTWRGNLGQERITLRPGIENGPVLIQIRQPENEWIHTVKRVKQ